MARQAQNFMIAALKRKVTARDALIRELVKIGNAGTMDVGGMDMTFDTLAEETLPDDQRKLLAEITAEA